MEGEDEIEVGEVDCGSHKSVCSKVDIHSYPTFKLFYEGEEVAKYKGEFFLPFLLPLLSMFYMCSDFASTLAIYLMKPCRLSAFFTRKHTSIKKDKLIGLMNHVELSSKSY